MQRILASAACMLLLAGAARAGPVDISLGAAGSFAVLGGSTVTNSGSTTINGDLGVWPGTSVTGFPPGIITGGTLHDSDLAAHQAHTALGKAITFASGETPTRDLTGQDLGGLTLTAGVYSFASFADLTGTLTLNGQNNANADFIFQIGSTLTTADASMISLINGAEGDHVFWDVGSSATLGTGSIFDGSILANTSISLGVGADIACGRALALTGGVTLLSNVISAGGSSCGGGGVAVPEPSTLALLIAGMAMASAAGCFRPRRRTAPIGA